MNAIQLVSSTLESAAALCAQAVLLCDSRDEVRFWALEYALHRDGKYSSAELDVVIAGHKQRRESDPRFALIALSSARVE